MGRSISRVGNHFRMHNITLNPTRTRSVFCLGLALVNHYIVIHRRLQAVGLALRWGLPQ